MPIVTVYVWIIIQYQQEKKKKKNIEIDKYHSTFATASINFTKKVKKEKGYTT